MLLENGGQMRVGHGIAPHGQSGGDVAEHVPETVFLREHAHVRDAQQCLDVCRAPLGERGLAKIAECVDIRT